MILNSALVAVSGAVFATGVYLLPHLGRWRQVRRLRERCTRSRSLVLTYDDGPGAEVTPRLLDMLAAHGVKATFFLLGCRLRTHAAIAHRIRAEAHEIGCHTQQHLNAWTTWPWRAIADIRDGYQTLSHWAGHAAPFRPPRGRLTALTWAAVRRRGAPVGWWTVDSGDTCIVLPSPHACVDAVRRAGGGVVLMHDFDREPARQSFVLEATRLLLQAARSEGLTTRPLCELP